jgi:hypothetical protein
MVIVPPMRSLFAAAAVCLVACSSAQEEPKTPKDAGANAHAAAGKPAADEAPPGTVARKSLDAVLLRRPPYVLGRVQMEEVLKQNKFIGWRLTSFPADWDKTGLQPGDVVTDVNGVALEKPEDLWTIWLALAEASEIRIGFERDGKAASTSVKIHGAPVPETKVALETGTGMPVDVPPAVGAAPSKPSRKRDTIVITDESANPGDDDSSAINY